MDQIKRYRFTSTPCLGVSLSIRKLYNNKLKLILEKIIVKNPCAITMGMKAMQQGNRGASADLWGFPP
ncbi:hypothetical protein BJP34_15660 [Moorena producens PAL-8-15-08-1]|uniref:Uncharacterized protein n=1 Tax=Moorena producens PAL-8-15-08-1 TaxID=1458985 RepID=A0A1D8TSS3_9CYAN|nr:hypothetical protein BJP34_15660 [Moorena producens PAL-8-15-08-1]